MNTPLSRHHILIAVTTLLVTSLACNLGSPPPSPNPPPQTPSFPIPTPVVPSPLPSPQAPPPTPTRPPQPTTPPPTSAPSTSSTPCDRASFVTDVTVQDNTKMSPGQTFTKTWRLKNNGSCTWTSGYALIFDRGDQMGAPSSTQLTTGTVPPGGTVDISVKMTAPNKPGTYQGFFKLKNASGQIFGIGQSANKPFWVKIVVTSGGGGGSSGGGNGGNNGGSGSGGSQTQTVTLNADAWNSGSVASDGSSNPAYIPGDDTNNALWIAYLQFDLTGIPTGVTVQSATLNLDCIWIDGDPFNDLGSLNVYYFYYGNLDPVSLSQNLIVFTDYLGSIGSCPDTPIDVTASLASHITEAYYQVAALFPSSDNGGDDDYIEITSPTLTIKYTP